MRFLLYKWKVFNQEDIKAALERAGHEVHVFNAVDFVREKQEEIENMLYDPYMFRCCLEDTLDMWYV